VGNDIPTASWTVTQPWRGVFGMLVCLGIALGISFAWYQDLHNFIGIMGNWAMCMVPIEVVIGVTWAGRFPADKFEQPWRGVALTGLMFFIGTLAFIWLTYIVGAGNSGLPILAVFIIMSVILTMFWCIAFGNWPFHKMSLPVRGLLTLMGVYLVLMAGFRLFNFNEIGVGELGRIPFVTADSWVGLEHFVGVNPGGPIAWDAGVTFFFLMIVFMFAFLTLGFWPITRFKSLCSQPIMGIVVFISCFALALISYAITAWGMDLEPMRVMVYFVCFAFGMLGIIFMFQMWPGRMWSQPVGGFVNLLLAVVLAIIAFFAIRAFCQMVFGPGLFTLDTGTGYLMGGPFGFMAMATVMLGLTFPAWAIYSPAWDFWPLPPTPGPPPH
jgi:hypothetical protein